MIDLAPMIVLLAAVAGVVLLWLGVRGRRLNEHPACRRCGFDLLGVFPGGANCPECGAPLGGRRAVRTGVRQRRRSLVVIGGGLVGVVLLVFATGVWFMFAGPSLNSYKPSFFLVLEGRYSDAAASRAAAKELLSRQTDGSLSDRQAAWAVSGALALQADTESVWVAEWGDLVERARAAGKVCDADYERFMWQSAVLALVARPGAARGETIPLAIGVVEWRCANTPALDLGVWVDEFRINDATVEWADYGGKRLALTNAEHPIQLALTGRAPGMRAASRTHADTMGLELDPLATVPPIAAAARTGVVTLRARVGCSGGARPGAMGRSAADWRLLEPGITLRARVALDGPAPTPRRVNDAPPLPRRCLPRRQPPRGRRFFPYMLGRRGRRAHPPGAHQHPADRSPRSHRGGRLPRARRNRLQGRYVHHRARPARRLARPFPRRSPGYRRLHGAHALRSARRSRGDPR